MLRTTLLACFTLCAFSLLHAEDKKPDAAPAESKPKVKPQVPADAAEFKGHFYKVYEERLSWHDAKKKCESLGGYLCCIETKDESDFITKLANDRYLFLGATDEAKEGEWKWVNGAKFEFTNWLDGQPNNYGDNEHYLETYDGGEWCDVAVEGDDFWMPIGFICEWESKE